LSFSGLRLPFPAVVYQIWSPTLQREIDQKLARVVLERDDVLEVVEGELAGSVSSGGGG